MTPEKDRGDRYILQIFKKSGTVKIFTAAPALHSITSPVEILWGWSYGMCYYVDKLFGIAPVSKVAELLDVKVDFKKGELYQVSPTGLKYSFANLWDARYFAPVLEYIEDRDKYMKMFG